VGSVDTTTQFTIAALRSENERLVSQIDNLKKTASVSSNNSQLQRDLEQSQAKVRSLSSRIQELELQLKTANSRNSDLDSQIRSLNLRIQELDTQLRTTKDIKSSAASENSQLVDSKYSSSSSSNINVTKTAFEVPSYASSSVYSVESSGLS
jgi:chromosome segregation ATPase